jgi:hypothetical protein
MLDTSCPKTPTRHSQHRSGRRCARLDRLRFPLPIKPETCRGSVDPSLCLVIWGSPLNKAMILDSAMTSVGSCSWKIIYMISPLSTFWDNAGTAFIPLETRSITLPTSDVVPLSAQAMAFVAFDELMMRKESF